MGWKAELLLERGDKCSARSIRWIADGEILHLPGRYSPFLLLFFYFIPSTHPFSFFHSFFLFFFYNCSLFSYMSPLLFYTLHINTCWKVLDTLLSVISWSEGCNSVWGPTLDCLHGFCKSVIHKTRDWLKVGL